MQYQGLNRRLLTRWALLGVGLLAITLVASLGRVREARAASTLPAGTSASGFCALRDGGILAGGSCTLTVPAGQGPGSYVVSVGGGILICSAGPVSCTASADGTMLTLAVTTASQPLSFILLVATAGTLDVTGPAGSLAIGVPLSAAIAETPAAGWNLVGGPAGTQLTGAIGPLYTYQAGDASYESLPPDTALSAGAGVWAYFPAQAAYLIASTSLPATSQPPIPLPAGHWIMVANPTNGPVDAIGMDALDTFNPPANQYTRVKGIATLAPGQGAFALSLAGGTLSFTPSYSHFPVPPP